MTEQRNSLIENNLQLANKVASIQFKKCPPQVTWDELQSAAYMGLVDAAIKYDGTRSFEKYAFYRIFGEVKDYLRSLLWHKPWEDEYDSVHEKEDDLEEFFEELTKNLNDLGKKIIWMYYVEDLTIQEVAKNLGLSSTRVHQLLKINLRNLKGNGSWTENLWAKAS